MLCSLCSFRALQKRLQVWFRAVPGMLDSLVASASTSTSAYPSVAVLASGALATVDGFLASCAASLLPLSQSEAYMLAQLLSRRRLRGVNSSGHTGHTHTGLHTVAEAVLSGLYVDATQLRKIKQGEFLHAALG
jgi:hypothetical protein